MAGAGPLGRRHHKGGRAMGKEARSRAKAGCRSQDQLQTQPGPMDPMRREGAKTPRKK